MKKFKLMFIVMLMTLSACGSASFETEGFGNFKLPSSFKEVETDEDYSIRYSDETEKGYLGLVYLATYTYSDEVPTFEDYAAFVKDEFIYSYGDALIGEGKYSVPVQSEIEIDGHKAVKTMIIGDDQFKTEIINVDITFGDGEDGCLEIVFDYSGKKYPNLVEDFIKSYRFTK